MERTELECDNPLSTYVFVTLEVFAIVDCKLYHLSKVRPVNNRIYLVRIVCKHKDSLHRAIFSILVSERLCWLVLFCWFCWQGGLT